MADKDYFSHESDRITYAMMQEKNKTMTDFDPTDFNAVRRLGAPSSNEDIDEIKRLADALKDMTDRYENVCSMEDDWCGCEACPRCGERAKAIGNARRCHQREHHEADAKC